MKYKLNKVEIIDPRSQWNRRVKDILVDNGRIRLAKEEDKYDKEIDAQGTYILPALCETYASIGDPGYEYREDIESVSEAALQGGVTAICAIADNQPVTQHKTQIDYLINSTKDKIVEIWPIGAITEQLKGECPTEFLDMHHAGAVAFSDAPHAVKSSGVMMRAIQYASPFGGLIYSIPYDEQLTFDGQINESVLSVTLGLSGIPHLAESLQVYRDLRLLEYTGGKLHFSGITTADAVRQIKEAKTQGLNVTASVYLHHLLLDENAVSDFDTNYKVMPPLRTVKDQKALKKGIADGVIDIVSVQHIPLDTESKRLEFEYAKPGMANLELAFPLALKALGDIEQVATHYAIRVREILNKENPVIEEGAKADFIWVDTQAVYIPTVENRKSKSANSPFFGQELKGKVKAVFNNQAVHFNE
ncbi:MAG: dihydroorotase [Chitinophagales bacterium]|nr:dihydroorotase [Chitinophagales bacterium]